MTALFWWIVYLFGMGLAFVLIFIFGGAQRIVTAFVDLFLPDEDCDGR